MCGDPLEVCSSYKTKSEDDSDITIYKFSQLDWETVLPSGYYCIHSIDNRELGNLYTVALKSSRAGGRQQESFALYQTYESQAGKRKYTAYKYSNNETLADIADTYDGEIPLEQGLYEVEFAYINLYERRVDSARDT